MTCYRLTQPLIWTILLMMGSCKPPIKSMYEPTGTHLKGRPYPAIVKNDSAYLFYLGEKMVLQYNYGPASLPPQVDRAYSRSGYIHPLLTPSGKRLTRIQPPDHLHHYGIWNAWTRTLFQEKTVDFWNLGQKTGRVDYIKTIAQIENKDYVSLRTLHQHSALGEDGEKIPALNEIVEITLHRTPEEYFIIDHQSAFNCLDSQGICLEEYRYGGFAIRGNENWDQTTVTMQTSEGKDQSNSDGERARWCLVKEKNATPASILLLSHPGNFNHPEPLRTWDEKGNNGKANIFINFSPIRNQHLCMKTDSVYLFRYRIITTDMEMTHSDIENFWSDFAALP